MLRKVNFFLLFFLFYTSSLYAETKPVFLLPIKGVINPITSRQISEGITYASKKKANLLIIRLDTPGGLLVSTRVIVEEIMSADIPVAVYVAPSGAQCASAGTFIALASPILAMAPATNIGAAHPVMIIGRMGKEMEEKVVNDAVSFIKGIAKKNHRNSRWAEDAVRKSLSVTEDEALKLGVIDLIAKDENELLSKLDGREVFILGKTIILRTKDRKIIPLRIRPGEKLLQSLSDPNIAYIFLILGIWGIIAEFSSPGIGFPGIVGAICLILSFFAFHSLPINIAGFLLIFLAITFFILEVKIVSYGLLTIGGIVSMILGSFMLIKPFSFILGISTPLIFGVSIFSAFLFLFVLFFAINAHRKKVTTGKEGLIGEIGEARTEFNPTGKLYVHGEYWNGRVLDDSIKKGEKVKVIKIDGRELLVKKVE
ncbi:MAG: serine protease [bacterium (Candidatus Ratteibacteria) CG_4_10_14_3_um_filter_41_18]|uniref:Serine protease n=4 Tax=Candidatus Ratteibacteria TaxID=2979319 RepID=A0A2M7E941_9BACT|nr:MAG: hypothetical protein AUJ76_01865 [Candidatus Omnitrophica bacterium CG1_02_41_171]PIV64266.1 MAG: serine protease [bacterium (Candidatus Ratteibacteria) CG01_land_8_20_14_3_00_40_19]PIW33963.1 MAG: serine protease [bacterium (Candidatus Ratteibacteria) CG15_BIG_FIL_POST_REV_8_21_14_020_41_12]PIW73805.1 MAG: serine protease [bacterium (Candidatus Ratteibacteria) CG_4_8_14_3_um_filter_41_36]PIX76790.1 MAG: serine protease [bacterium (Candidatus Ratteibacteria) CG_4_10_14_3_um_filter_41_18